MKKIILLIGLLIFSANSFAADKQLKVVATTTYFADMVKQIGGENVDVHAVAPPKFNVHFIQPRPSDVAKTAQADLFVFGGLDLEAWADPLLEASGKLELFRGRERNVDLSRGIALKKIPEILSRAEGDLHAFGNPHYVMSPENAKIMVETLSVKLQEIDSEHADYYRQRKEAFLAELNGKIMEWKKLCAHCAGKEIFSYHDDVVYLTDFLEIKEGRYLEPKPGVPPTPKQLAFLEGYADKNKVEAIVAASYYPKRTLNKLAKKINTQVVLILQTPDYSQNIFDFYDVNIRAISDALK